MATNIAETSVTLPGIVYVVDSGFSKQKFYNPMTDVEALVVAPVSQASAEQRAGRAGRERPGKCFRLYTEDTYSTMMPESVPEIQKANLISTILQLKALGIDNVMQFDWLAPPPAEFMVRALELLYSLGILDRQAKLTSPLGFQVAELPLDPIVAKMLLSAAERGCWQEGLTIAAVLSVQTIWASGRERREMDEARARFGVAEGDLVSYLNVYEGWLHARNRGHWCHQNCVHYQAMVSTLYPLLLSDSSRLTFVKVLFTSHLNLTASGGCGCMTQKMYLGQAIPSRTFMPSLCCEDTLDFFVLGR